MVKLKQKVKEIKVHFYCNFKRYICKFNGKEIVSEKLSSFNINFEKAKILVVDDVEENIKLIQASLKDFDFDLIIAKNGKESIDILKNVNVDLILMDLRMPVMNGYEAAAIIKADTKLKAIPLIALTASAMGKDLEKVSEFGFDGYLRKPVIIDDLIEELSKHLKYYFINQNLIEENNSQLINSRNLQIVLDLLENDLKKEWMDIKNGGDFSLIEEFANKLNALAIDQKYFYTKRLCRTINKKY